MKKNKTYALILLSAILSYACQEENITEQCNRTNKIVFIAQNNDNNTKTSRQDNGDVWWSPGDEIKIFCGETSGRFTAQNAESASTAIFSGLFDEKVSSEELSNGVFALYPYSDDIKKQGNLIIFTLPTHQTGRAESFSENLFPAYAMSNNNELEFRNICGGVKFSVSRNDIKTVTLRSNKTTAADGYQFRPDIAGSIAINTETGDISLRGGADEIVVTAPDGGYFEPEKYYYIVTYPKSLSNGFELIFNDGEMVYNSFMYNEPVEISRSKFGVLTELDANLNMVDASAEINFADDVMLSLCLTAYDNNTDGVLSYGEAVAADDLSDMKLTKTDFKSFDEFQYFTSVTIIPQSYFKGTEIQSIICPKSLLQIYKSAFEGCSNLMKVDLNENVWWIQERAFFGCSNLEDITLPQKTRWLSGSAFEGCSSLTSISIPGKRETIINSRVFYGCSSLTNVTIQEGVQSIWDEAFANCLSMKEIVIPATITKLGNYVFAHCSQLEHVYIKPDTPPTIGYSLFMECPALLNIYVPANAIDTYKSADGWSKYADYIVGYDYENNTVVE